MSKQPHTKHLIRGGQMVLHNLRMMTQVMVQALGVGGLCFVLIGMLWCLYYLNPEDWQLLQSLAWARVLPLFNPHAHQLFHGVPILSTELSQQPGIQARWVELSEMLSQGLTVSLWGSLSLFVGLLVTLTYYGHRQAQDRYQKGDQLASIKVVQRQMRAEKAESDLHLGALPCVKGTERQHFLYHGTTGSGKSNAIAQLLTQIRARGDQAILYDEGGEWLRHFFNPTTDALLNPFDERSHRWSLWESFHTLSDFEQLAQAQIPLSPRVSDPFWVNGARTLYAHTAYTLSKQKKPTLKKLLHYLLVVDLVTLHALLKATPAATLVSPETEKTAQSLRSVLATYLTPLQYMAGIDKKQPLLDIKAWIQSPQQQGWLFFSASEQHQTTLCPLITTWLDHAMRSLLSIEPSQTRRLWLILDELASLQQLPALRPLLAKGRKFGGCVVIGLQSYAQLVEHYGNAGAQGISALLNTRLYFRQPDVAMARWSARSLGESTLERVREGVTYGASTMRDGVSLSHIPGQKPLVTYPEIMRLADLHAYVRLPGAYPITLLTFTYQPLDAHHPPYLEQ